jgi:glutamyl-tRNA reductase
MSFFALGVNHQTASVELREQIAFNPERLKDLFAVESLRQNLNDMVVVSTCNRTEVYAMAENADMVLNWLAQTNGIDVKQLSNHVYRYENTDAVSHLMRVQPNVYVLKRQLAVMLSQWDMLLLNSHCKCLVSLNSLQSWWLPQVK